MGLQALEEGFDTGVSAYAEACDVVLSDVCKRKKINLTWVSRRCRMHARAAVGDMQPDSDKPAYAD